MFPVHLKKYVKEVLRKVPKEVQQKEVIRVCGHPHLNLILIHLKDIEEVVLIQQIPRQIPIRRFKGIVNGLIHLK